MGRIGKNQLSEGLVKEINNKVNKEDVNEIKNEVGNEVLNTTSKTIKGGINELDSDIKSLNKVKKNVTILTTGWIQDPILSLYKYKIEDADITADTIVDVNIKLADLEKVSDFKSSNESFLGYVEIYSDSIPTASISCDLKLIRQVM